MNAYEKSIKEVESKVIKNFKLYMKVQKELMELKFKKPHQVAEITSKENEVVKYRRILENLYEWLLHFDRLKVEETLFGHPGIY